jgi:hypothetical protein
MNVKQVSLWVCCIVAILSGMTDPSAWAQGTPRTTLSLNGAWDVEDSVNPDSMPKAYTHKALVPGLTHAAVPAFKDVDQYQSRELLSNLVQQGRYSKADPTLT